MLKVLILYLSAFSVVGIINKRSSWLHYGYDLIIEFLLKFQGLLILHLLSLEWKTVHIKDEILVIDKMVKNIFDRVAVVGFDLGHEL